MRMLVALLLLNSCAREISPWEKAGVRIVDGVPQLREVEIELERTECLGWCPAYSVKLSGDGTLTYTGVSYVKTKGERKTSFDPQALLPLLVRFAEIDFLGQKHNEHFGAMDAPKSTLMLRIGSRALRYHDGLPDPSDFEEESLSQSEKEWFSKLHEIATAIDDTVNVASWIGTEAERETHRDEWR